MSSTCTYNGLGIIGVQAPFVITTYTKLSESNPEDSYAFSIKKDGIFHVKNHVWCGCSLNMMEL